MLLRTPTCESGFRNKRVGRHRRVHAANEVPVLTDRDFLFSLRVKIVGNG